MKKPNIYYLIGCNFKKAMDQSKTFTSDHVRYDVSLVRYDDHEKTMKIEYQCNPKVTTVEKDDVLYCILSDAQCYEFSEDDISLFADSLGIENVKEAIDAFNACKETYNNLIDFLGSEENYRKLQKCFENY